MLYYKLWGNQPCAIMLCVFFCNGAGVWTRNDCKLVYDIEKKISALMLGRKTIRKDNKIYSDDVDPSTSPIL